MTREKSHVWVAALLGIAFVVASFVLAGAYVRGHSTAETIRVIGSARRPIRSDFIIWTGRVTQSAPTVDAAYTALTADVAKVRAYLGAKGISAAEIVPAAIVTKTLYARTNTDRNANNDQANDAAGGVVYRPVVGYQLSEDVSVRSQSVDLVDSVSRQSTELISKGIPLESDPPQYLSTKLSDLKVTMQAEAARDARARAEQIAASSGCRLGAVRHANMSAPVITPLYSNALSDGGVDDTTSLDKRITAVVTIEYAVR